MRLAGRAVLSLSCAALIVALLSVAASRPAAAQDIFQRIGERLDGFFRKLGQQNAQPRRLAPAPPQSTSRVARRATRPPLPRPRPPGLAGAGRASTPGAPDAPLEVGREGEVLVRPRALGRERDPMRAAYLTAKERGSWSQADLATARKRCRLLLATSNVDATILPAIGGKGGCGIAVPIEVRALGPVKLRPPAKLNCTFTAALYRWVVDVVQPAARKHFGQPVVAIGQISDYACRRRGGVTRGRVLISEHAFGNALDIATFRLAGGGRISVLKNWSDFFGGKSAAFLRDVQKGSCAIFSTSLSPRENRAHRNHFHFDMGRDGRYRYCK